MTERSRLRVEPLPGRVGLVVEGEIDVMTRGDWAAALRPLVDQGAEVDLELALLVFVDVGGVAVMVTAAQRLAGGRRMILHRPPRALVRTLEVMFPRTPSIEVNAR